MDIRVKPKQCKDAEAFTNNNHTHVRLLNSPNEKSFSIFACPHQESKFFTVKRVPSVIIAQKKLADH